MNEIIKIEQESTGLTVAEKRDHQASTRLTAVMFDENARAMAKVAAESLARMNNIPSALKGRVNDIIAIVCMARQLGMEPAMLMQKCFVINGKIGFESQLIIALANVSGVFEGRINYRMNDAKTSCVAYATLRDTGEVVESAVVDMAMVKRFDWDAKKGSSPSMWTLMPEQMLRYRAATFLVRSIAPEVLIGINDKDELIDSQEGNRVVSQINNEPNPFADTPIDVPDSHQEDEAIDAMANEPSNGIDPPGDPSLPNDGTLFNETEFETQGIYE